MLKCRAITIQITPAFFTDLEQTILRFVWNQKRPQIATAIFKNKTKPGGITILDFQDVLQSCNQHDSMVLAHKQTLRSMEHNTEARNGPINVWPTNL